MTNTPAVPNGTITAHGHTWPVYERPAWQVHVVGTIDAIRFVNAEELCLQLESILKHYGVSVRVEPAALVDMLPDDKAEKHRFDDLAAQGLSHLIPSALDEDSERLGGQ